jgi:hypothetical protein
MSTNDAMFSAGIGVARRSVAHAGLFPPDGSERPRRSVSRWIALLVLVISLVGLWTSAGLAHASPLVAADAVTVAPDGAVAHGVGAPAGSARYGRSG